MWKQLKRDFWLALFAVSVFGCAAGCSIFGAATPQSPSEAVAYAYGTVASLRQAAATALQGGTISVNTAETILSDTDTARTTLDAAELILQSSPSGSDTVTKDLSDVMILLQAAQALLPSVGTAGSASSPVSASAPGI